MPGIKKSSLPLLAATAALIAAALVPRPAAAVVYESEPAFCQQTVLRDFLSPLAQLPKLRQPLPDGRLGFSSAKAYLQPSERLVLGGGKVGYRLTSRFKAPVIHPGWKVTTTLARVGWGGQAIQRLGKVTKTISSLGRGKEGGVQFDVGPPAPYRLTVVFRSADGRKLAKYGFYFRVVKKVADVRLVLDANAYRPEETVFAQLQNLGTETWTYGLGHWIERLTANGWVEAPENPRMVVPAVAIFLKPGTASKCEGFWIPPTMPPGRYRILRGSLAAEFDVLP